MEPLEISDEQLAKYLSNPARAYIPTYYVASVLRRYLELELEVSRLKKTIASWQRNSRETGPTDRV